jgi:hypothetical protein
MEVSATITSSGAGHDVIVRTGSTSQSLAIPAKPTGLGSAINGGEFLMFRYRAVVRSSATPELIAELLRQTDAVAEVHNTVRAGVPVELIRQ